MRYARALRQPFVLSAALVLAGCPESPVDPGPVDPGPGAGPNGPGTPPPPPPPPPEPATASVPHGTPALYLSTSTDASVFNGIIGEVIEGSRQNFVQLVPATGEAALIDSNLSVSYAQSRSTIKTFDDGIYIVNVSETGARLQRFDNEALLSSPPDRPVPVPRAFDSLEEDCFVVQGSDMVYKVAWRRASYGRMSATATSSVGPPGTGVHSRCSPASRTSGLDAPSANRQTSTARWSMSTIQ